jgi:hypothetical protein
MALIYSGMLLLSNPQSTGYPQNVLPLTHAHVQRNASHMPLNMERTSVIGMAQQTMYLRRKFEDVNTFWLRLGRGWAR